ncbi:NAC domain-containing protein 71-like [Chenopodium quinoa]|uniref:NAC domain-containing protein n=1 Tax=Chenopodium quinoa TaxID=63459 RepID=A0A803MWP6_CHEQI|nr:NAC domain-containing protein 71-like [Chenopodium quinoa]XP_021743922.1 NAC domain-containing protein 71-like [Chenopodium quinoa]
MEAPKAPLSPSILPPGCRFYPSEEQLLSYYLGHKNHLNSPQQSSSSSSNADYYDAIKEINLYDYNPFDLPELTCFRFGCGGRKRHWYCFTERVNGEEEERGNRRAGIGYWKRKGRVRDVMGNGGNVILGTRKCFIFYLEKSNGKTAVRTDWFMYEYTLIDSFKASFVVCRVFVKSRVRNSISEHALSSCAEESIATVRHIGIQHDSSTVSVLDEDKAHGFYYVNGKIAGQPTKLMEETEPNIPVKSPGHVGSADLVNSSSPRHLVSIVDGDFIELDDLL